MRPRFLIAAIAISASCATAAEKPNVIIIIADDLGYGDVSCNGQGEIQTPAIDKLAADGMRLTAGFTRPGATRVKIR
ncbi:MAG: sulfatase-like hydrolase/transferase [Verrucomicrobiota bacterium]